MLRAASVLLPLLVIATASPILAANNPANTTAQRWVDQLDTSSDLLKAGDYERSLKITTRLLREMVDGLGPGDGAMKVFGTALSHKALALAGLHREADALWYWHTVLTLYPAFAKSDVSMFGEAGAFLDRNREPRKLTALTGREKELGPELSPPKLLKRVQPEFPYGARYFGVSGQLVVGVVITKEGTVAEPVVITALPAPTLSFVALEALRRWRFEPARKNGEAIDVQFNLTVNFKLSN
jgi:TonB family protein